VADDDDDDKKSSWLQNAFGFVADKATAAGSALADAGSAVVQKVEDAGAAVAQDAQAVVQKVEDTGSAVVQDAKAVVQKVENTGAAVVQKVEDTGAAVVQKVEDTGAAVVQKVEDEGKAVVQAADNLVKQLEGSGGSALLDSIGQGAGSATWNAPFDLGSCDNTDTAGESLVRIKNMLQEWYGAGFDAEMSLASNAIDKQLAALGGPIRPLTPAEADALTATGLMAQQAIHDTLAKFVASIAAELDKYSRLQSQPALDAAAELLHQDFRHGDGEDQISDVKELFSKAKELDENIAKYVDYALKTKSFIKQAEKLEVVKQGLETFKGKMEEAENTLNLASEVATLAGKVGQKPSGTADDINRLKAGLKIADLIISKTSVPIIGVWWTEYIKPCTEMALQKLQALDDANDSDTRQNRMDEWWETARRGTSAPSITDSGLNGENLKKVFPAGQPMLDFMWSLFRGNPPNDAPRAVATEFLKFRKQFNAGLPEDDQLQTDAAWYNAWDLFSEEKSPNLMSWVVQNKEHVWAMEYGSLPHP
jgi:hypothetical protein